MVCCGICGCKRCPHSDDHDNTCTNSNEPGQLGSRYGIMPATDDTPQDELMPTTKPTEEPVLDAAKALQLAESWGKNPEVTPSPDQLRAVVNLLAAEVRRLSTAAVLEESAQPATKPQQDNSMLDGLTYAQLEFMKSIVGPERKQVADYIRRQVPVQVVANTEVSDAPAFALDMVENPGYWLNCFETAELAEAAAIALGLPVTPMRKK